MNVVNMVLAAEIKRWVEQRRNTICHRQLLVISGEQPWVYESVRSLLAYKQPDTLLWLGEDTPESQVDNRRYKQIMGQEFDCVVYDAFSGLRANALFAVSGCVTQQNLMIMLCPPLSEWPKYADPEYINTTTYGYNTKNRHSYFVSWLCSHIQTDPHIALWQAQKFKGPVAELNAQQPSSINHLITEQQTHLVESILSITAQPEMKMVLSADRGRGKSSTLGIVAGSLMLKSPINIVVCAVNISMCDQIFKHAARLCALPEGVKNSISYQQSTMRFLPFDKLLEQPPAADLILVDEAAAIPNKVLEDLLNLYPKIIFSTTIQGYEGSGRGFELRFKPYLVQHYKHTHLLSLTQPIRWFNNDSLEQFWFKVMATQSLMQPKAPVEEPLIGSLPNRITHGTYHYSQLSPTELIKQPLLLECVFQLLVEAHYQTRPDDLKRMLDSPDQKLHVLFDSKGIPVAVALTNDEGGPVLDPLKVGIAEGQRRVAGHLTAQRLAFEYCAPHLAGFRYLRVVRIAVANHARLTGLGSTLVDKICQHTVDTDFIATSYGLTPELFDFWSKNDFHMVRLGLKKDAASGQYSGLMLRSLSLVNQVIIDNLSNLSAAQLAYQQNHRLENFEPVIMTKIFSKIDSTTRTTAKPDTSTLDKMVKDFIAHKRPLHSLEWYLYLWLLCVPEDISLQHKECQFVKDLLVEKLPYEALQQTYKLTGKKQIEAKAREAFSRLAAIVRINLA
ncbi:GNAT family N-acetyltransferase [Aliiglaciecola sp. LCG003]|uniref:GNAT family N-acetyltransferase n=1 Tax=Aliiglaciecola sp. LCG003 TaxID=3053655 RepID=UPI002572ABF6|nr:GNAT family N-acetyltransferase [Aliiglaciecola sp. LCG003]WJG08344.1 GNAT family N-acetyltransferase [Aliiglaciecola sp. LCG003]